jgi:diacylglycerol kinase family enzyme
VRRSANSLPARALIAAVCFAELVDVAVVKPARVAVLLNASAGTIEGQDGNALRDSLQSAFQRHAISATIELAPGADLRASTERALQRAAAGDLGAIVVGGGDGTIRTVASIVGASSVPLGIIPLGTLNHFAKDLGLPLEVEEAVAVIAAGEVRSVDLGEVNGMTFINNSSIGVYPYLVLDRERRRSKQGLAKWIAMILATLRALRNFPLRRLSVHAEGRTERWRSPLVLVGNNEYVLTGLSLGKRERLDRGELCLYVAKKQSRLSLFWLACRSVLGRVEQPQDLRILKVRAAEIRSHASRLLVACDGEVQVMRSPLHYHTRPGALRVFAPPAP